MIYICCIDAVDATAYASTVLKIKLRSQSTEARIVSVIGHVPTRCRGLDIKATPEFWTAMTSTPVSLNATRNIAARTALNITRARTIATAVRLRGGVIAKPYDVPETMAADDVEAWLED